MRHVRRFAPVGFAGMLVLASCSTLSPARLPRSSYPVAHKVDQVDNYHGTTIADPYRWFEDLDSTETKAWVEAENKVTSSCLGTISAREAIRARLTELWNYEKMSVPFREGGRTLYTRNSGLQPQSVWYVQDTPGAQPRVLLDPNTLSKDGTVALSGSSVSDDGTLFAYALSSAGSDWQEWHVRDVLTTKDLSDGLKWIKFTRAAWTKDSKGFFYARYDEPAPGMAMTATNYNQKLYYHRLGTPQEEDTLVYARPDHKDWEFRPDVSEDGRYVLIVVHVGTDRRNMIFYRDLTAPDVKVTELLSESDANYDFIGNDGPVFYVQTDQSAPRGRVVAIDTRSPKRESWRQLIGQRRDALQRVSLINDTFVAFYLKDATTNVRFFRSSGESTGELTLPGIGTASGFAGKRTDSETFYSFTSFTAPPAIYHLDLTTRESTIYHRPEVKFDPEAYFTEQVFYISKDGTKVPMFITRKKGVLLKNGQNPTLLYGYGGFNISVVPSFSVANLVWMEMGGIYAVANLRGGNEYGEAWHQGGMLKNKQRVFEDFIAAAEWLIANGYTSKKKLAINGGSNGGLLVGAVLNQRPDLFGAAIPEVGVMDMLRFHKFTIGWGWVSEYGSSDDPAMFPTLRAYSPLHNIKTGVCYPPTLIMTADHDDRVVPAHSFKYAATLQKAQDCANPILIRIETRAGHGAGRPTAKLIAAAADRFAFLSWALGIAPPKF
jgi:prolyl oligopeptidase